MSDKKLITDMGSRYYMVLSFLLYASFVDQAVTYYHGNKTMTKQEAISFCDKLVGDEQDTNSLLNYMKENNISRTWLRLYKKDLGQWTWTNNLHWSGQLPGGGAERACAGISSVERVLRPMKCNYGGEHEGVICEHHAKLCQNTRCYQLDDVTFAFECDVANWFAARDFCLKNNGTMAVMDTQRKINKFSERKQRNPGLALCNFFWVGLRRAEWYTDEGRLPIRTLWLRGEPKTNRDCSVAELTDEKRLGWRTVSCADKHIAVCTAQKPPLTYRPFTEKVTLPSEGQTDWRLNMTTVGKGLERFVNTSTLDVVPDPHLGIPFTHSTGFIVIMVAVGTVILVILIIVVSCTIKSRWKNSKPNIQTGVSYGNDPAAEEPLFQDTHSERTMPAEVDNDRINTPVECIIEPVFEEKCTYGPEQANAAILSDCNDPRIQDTEICEPENEDKSDNQIMHGHGNTTGCKEIKLAFVGPRSTIPNTDQTYLRVSTNEDICKVEDSQSKDEGIIEYLCRALSEVITKEITTRSASVLVTIEHVIVAKQEIKGEVLVKLIEILMTANIDVALLNISLPFSMVYCDEMEQKVHNLSQTCVLITPSFQSQLAQSTITVGRANMVSFHGYIRGGLLDFVVEESDQNYWSDGVLAAIATVIATKTIIAGEGRVTSTRTMRRALIDIFQRTKEHDPTKGFGFLKITHVDVKRQMTSKGLEKTGNGQHKRDDAGRPSTALSNSVQQGNIPANLNDNKMDILLEILGDRTSKRIIGIIGTTQRLHKMRADNIMITEKSFFSSLLGISKSDALSQYFEFVHENIDPKKPTSGFIPALHQMLQRNVDVIIQMDNLEENDTGIYTCLNQAKRSCVIISGLESTKNDYRVRNFPTADAIAVRAAVDKLCVVRPAGGRIDFVEHCDEVCQLYPGPFYHGPWFTGIVATLVILFAEASGVKNDQLKNLRTTAVMRHVLVEMCSHPEEHRPGEGYGVLEPWPFLSNPGRLRDIIGKSTKDNQIAKYWAGKDI